MAKLILGAYSAEAIAALILFILAIPVLVKLHLEKSYGSSFFMALGLTLVSAGEFIRRLWWTVWKAEYISHNASVWMLNHEIVLFSSGLVIGGILFLAKAVSHETRYSIPWRLIIAVLLCVMFLGVIL